MSDKKTALYQTHLDLNARMVPFAGYLMPLKYTSEKAEHMAVRQQAGLFDVSHMGEFLVEGTGALPLLQWVTSNNVAKLAPGKVQYSCLPNNNGGIVDDLLVYMLAPNKYMLVVNAANIQKDWDWITQQNTFGAELTNVSDHYTLLALQGPDALKILQPLTQHQLSSMAYYTFELGSVAGVDQVIISATGYTGAGGFELYIPNNSAETVWKKLFEQAGEGQLLPAGLACRDTLRLEMGYCLYGNDIDDNTSPIEAGLSWITKFDKDFINKANLLKQKENGVARKLVGLKLFDKTIARHGYRILNAEGKQVGVVTSGTISPMLGQPIALGYVSTKEANTGTPLLVQVRNRQVKAEVVKPPFYKIESN